MAARGLGPSLNAGEGRSDVVEEASLDHVFSGATAFLFLEGFVRFTGLERAGAPS